MIRSSLLETYFLLQPRVGGHFIHPLGILPPVSPPRDWHVEAELPAWKDELFIKHIFGGLQWVLASGSRQA